jgi:UDP-N-acetyl-D-glucosamine dehydrogenase
MTTKGTHDIPDSNNRSVAIVGLGYVGLPLAILFVEQGDHVIGIDVDQTKIEALKKGLSYSKDLTDEELEAARVTGRFQPTTQFDDLGKTEAVIICVPTPLSANQVPDMSFLHAAVTDIGKRLRPGQLIVLESSTYPGTTTEVIVPILERESGLIAGRDFHVGYSPERIDPGNKRFKVRDIPKVVSGLTPDCLKRTVALYSNAFDQLVQVSSPEVAEMTKLLENTYRLVNISFMNEMAMVCDGMGIDLWEVIEAAKTKSFGYAAFYPGPGAGGHCIPVDPLYLQWRAGAFGLKSSFIELAEKLNHVMVDYLADRVLDMSNKAGYSVFIYGVAYKKDIDDVRESAALTLIERLLDIGTEVAYHDPHVSRIVVRDRVLDSVELSDERLQEADCVFLMTDHTGIPVQRIVANARKIVDARNVTSGIEEKHIYRVGSGAFGLNRSTPL